MSILLVLTSALFTALEPGQDVSLDGLDAPVAVHFDDYGIPHVYADSWRDAAMVLGYLHASERLFQMDIYRRTGSGTLSEVLGRGQLPHDIRMRQLGIRRTAEAYWNSDRVPAAYRVEMEAYARGVNARMGELSEKGLPAAFRMLGYEPAPWTPVDSLAFIKYMGWDQGGTDDDLWFGLMVESLGVDAAESLWPLDRPYEIPTVKSQAARNAIPRREAGDWRLEAGGRRSEAGAVAAVSDAREVIAAALETFQGVRWLNRGEAFGSNNWAVSGSKTRSGKPILCSDPHLGFQLPSIWYTVHVSVKGESVAGAAFAVAPFVIIGHNDRLGWGITNMQADAVDYFVETIDPDDPTRYLHRGEWKPVERITETIRIRGEDPHVETIDYTVHGPIISREGKAISLQWTGLGETRDGLSLWKLNRAKNIEQALDGLDDIIVPALNMVYADADGNIAIHPCGDLPIRLPGAGRVPMDGGSGDHDWRGMIPREDLPLAVNPAEGYVASANGRPAPIGYPFYLGWMWDPSYRTRRLTEILQETSDYTIKTMKAVQYDAYDIAAERFLPSLLEALESKFISDAFAEQALAALRNWDYVARGETPAPMIWLRWLYTYRDFVWEDEWESRGIEQPGGSWGFSGTNRREPMMEVLEFMTRELPESPWFDDRRTPERETFREIAYTSFTETMKQLSERAEGNVRNLEWNKINILRISSITAVPELAREGGPVPGTPFTLNPGSSGGNVGGGASWRMIVDFADPSTSVGVYPGGQSEDAASAHYADQMPLWASGDYIPLQMVASPDSLSDETRARKISFQP